MFLRHISSFINTENMCIKAEKAFVPLWSDVMITTLVQHVLQSDGLPVPACFKYERVATWGDSCSIDVTLFSRSFPDCTYSTLKFKRI